MTGQAEPSLNAVLAGLLDSPTVSAAGETQVGSGTVDVLADVAGTVVAVECKKTAKTGATGRALKAAAVQAAERVEAGEADFAVAVAYPPCCTPAALAATDGLAWAAVDPDGKPGTRHAGSVDALRCFLADLPHSPDTVARRLQQTLAKAAGRLDPDGQDRLTSGFRAPGGTAAERRKAAVRALLMVAAAAMFHERLHPVLKAMPTKERPRRAAGDGEWRPPDPPGVCRADDDPVAAFTEAWDLILEVDYRPIFESARHVLAQMHGSHAFRQALKETVTAALGTVSTGAKLRYDLLGSVFHRVLDTARHDGSFYTTSAAATLLAGLTIADRHADWSDPEAVVSLRICDPACGSGALLLASLERVETLCGQAARPSAGDAGDDRWLRLSEMIEQSIWGYDINTTAIHLAATTLGLAAPDVSFRQMRLFTSQHGVDASGHVHLGSLDLLSNLTGRGDEQMQIDRTWAGGTKHSQAELDEHQDAAVSMGRPGHKADIVIANPPFTRDSLRHDHLGQASEQTVKAAEKKLLAGLGSEKAKAARLHSSGGMFLLLADHLADEGTGTVGFVLPAVVATSTGNEDYRKFLASRFAVEYLVVSHDPQRINFSGNTDISEMLVVARRRPHGGDPPTPKLAVLLRNPSGPAESKLALEEIRKVAAGGVSSSVEIYDMDTARTDAGDWRQAGFVSGWLHGEFLAVEAACATLHEQAPVNVAGQGIRGVYTKHALHTGRKALWDHKSDRVTTMQATPDCHIRAKPAKRHLADRYWQLRSRLLIPNRLRLNTMRLAAVMSDEPAVGSAFVPAVARDDTHAKALCVWLNSTLGLLGFYGNRTLKVLSYPRFSMADLRSLPVPRLDDAQAGALAAAFDAHAGTEMLSFKDLGACPVRSTLDAEVAAVWGSTAGFPDTRIARVREALAAEPAISGRRAGQTT